MHVWRNSRHLPIKQNEISQKQSEKAKIFQRRYSIILKVLPNKTIKHFEVRGTLRSLSVCFFLLHRSNRWFFIFVRKNVLLFCGKILHACLTCTLHGNDPDWLTDWLWLIQMLCFNDWQMSSTGLRSYPGPGANVKCGALCYAC